MKFSLISLRPFPFILVALLLTSKLYSQFNYKEFINKFKYSLSNIYDCKNKNILKVKYTLKKDYQSEDNYLSPYKINLKFLKTCNDLKYLEKIKLSPNFYDIFFSQINNPLPLNYRSAESLNFKESILLERMIKKKEIVSINEFQKQKFLNEKFNFLLQQIQKSSDNELFFLPSRVIRDYNPSLSLGYNHEELTSLNLSPYNFELNHFLLVRDNYCDSANESTNHIKYEDFLKNNGFLLNSENENFICISELTDLNRIKYYILVPKESLLISLSETKAEQLVQEYDNNIGKYCRPDYGWTSEYNNALKSKILNCGEDKRYNDILLKVRKVDIDFVLSIDNIRIWGKDENMIKNSTDLMTSQIENYIIFASPRYINVKLPLINKSLFSRSN